MAQECYRTLDQVWHHRGTCAECQPPKAEVEMCEVCTNKPATDLLQRVPLCSSCWATCAIFLGRTDRSYCAYLAARDAASRRDNCDNESCMKHNPTPEYVDAASVIPSCLGEGSGPDLHGVSE